jgi:DNA-binding NarL/FixJ family response regulator
MGKSEIIMRQSRQIRILLADDHAMVRQGLRLLIERETDIELIHEAEDGYQAVERVRELLPDIVIMDISMPNLNGIEATRQIVDELPQVKVIGLSMHSNNRFIADMLVAGASGYVLKECLFEELVEAIREVNAGKTYLSSRITGLVVDDYRRRLTTGVDSPLSSLKDREREILRLIAEGKTTKQIALELHVSTKTIDANRLKIMEKLNAHSIVDLVKVAIAENLIDFDLDRVAQTQAMAV